MRTDRQLWQLLDGELPEAEAARLRAEAAGDAEFAARISALASVKRGILAGTPPVPPGFSRRIEALASRGGPAPAVDLDEIRRFLRRSLVAAAILGAIGLAYLAAELGPKLLAPPPLQAKDPLLGGR